ncbi:MAG: PDZ domain-containing protein [Desulfobacula sp.]
MAITAGSVFGKPSGSFNLTVRDSLINLKATDASLKEVLESLSKEFSFSLSSLEPITDGVSLTLSGSTLTSTIEKLLANRNHALTYKKDSKGRSVPDTLWIFNKNPQGSSSSSSSSKEISKPIQGNDPNETEEHLKKYAKKDLASIFNDNKKILLSFDAEPIGQGESKTDNPPGSTMVPPPPGPEKFSGFKITRLSPSSPLSEIGFQEGDQITQINGKPVGSAADFVQTLGKTPGGGASVFHITRYQDGQLKPIYIQLQ